MRAGPAPVPRRTTAAIEGPCIRLAAARTTAPNRSEVDTMRRRSFISTTLLLLLVWTSFGQPPSGRRSPPEDPSIEKEEPPNPNEPAKGGTTEAELISKERPRTQRLKQLAFDR